LTAFAPILTQAAVLVVAACMKNWMMLAMISPSLLTSVIFAISSTSGAENGKNTVSPESQTDTTQADRTPNSRHAIGTVPLENLLTAPDGSHLSFCRETFSWRWVVHRWILPRQTTMDVPIGMTSGGVINLDLQRHGPHALIGGTTGSGKSVLLQAWCTSLATHNSPRELTFVFLDFKGGSTFRLLHQLPHVAGFVSDLSLDHAVRALKGLEEELTRREGLVAAHNVTDIYELDDPPAHLLVVVDEFAALKTALPDYLDHLMRIASQGRSLGIHLILATQNPQGQISANMKANISLGICLRVRDAMQSQDIIGSPLAASIAPQEQGVGYVWNGEELEHFHCSPARNLQQCIDSVKRASRFLDMPVAHALFSDPLPPRIAISDISDCQDASSPQTRLPNGIDEICGIPVGLVDSGIRLSKWNIDVIHGNIAIIGPKLCGKTTALRTIHSQFWQLAQAKSTQPDKIGSNTAFDGEAYLPLPHPRVDSDDAPRALLLVDDADRLFDPLHTDERSAKFQKALGDPDITVIFTVSTARIVRFPEHCSTRVIFPTGDDATDLIAGIPKDILAALGKQRMPGRAIELSGSKPHVVQFAYLRK
jgi:S-DNA-T family DNA segregation ATPase FtsK/SpoIIIE